MNNDLLALLDAQIAEAETQLAALREARAIIGGRAVVARARRVTRTKPPRPAKNGSKVPTCSACGKPGHNRRSCDAKEDD